MHFAINMLNNWAFAYDISVPVHIILRSFGSVTTMLAGVIRGKRYSLLQVVSVVLLTFGVLISAWADSESKVSDKTTRFKIDCSRFGSGQERVEGFECIIFRFYEWPSYPARRTALVRLHGCVCRRHIY